MSTVDPSPPSAPAAPPQRSGCLTALMAILGVIMLLPGLCALLFSGISVVESGKIDSDIAPPVGLGLLIAVGGVALILVAVKGRKSPPHPGTQP